MQKQGDEKLGQVPSKILLVPGLRDRMLLPENSTSSICPKNSGQVINTTFKIWGTLMIVKELFDRVRNARSDHEKAIRRNQAGMLALGVSIGCTVGAVAGVLLAPKTGKETREEVSRRSTEAWEKVKDTVSSNGHRLVNAVEEIGAQVCTACGNGIQPVEEALEDLSGKVAKADLKLPADPKK
mgnify:CR=1 FL=1